MATTLPNAIGPPYSDYYYQPQSDITELNGDIRINGNSLQKFMDTVNERLAILTPDPKQLQEFEALRNAYDNYKMLEKLCYTKENI